MNFGKTFDNTVRPLGTIFGILALLFSFTYVFGTLFGGEHLTDLNVWLVLSAPLAWLVLLCFLISLTFISLSVTNELIQIRLFHRFVFREEKTTNLIYVVVLNFSGRDNGISLHFCNGHSLKIYFQASEVRKFLDYVKPLTNNQVEIQEQAPFVQ